MLLIYMSKEQIDKAAIEEFFNDNPNVLTSVLRNMKGKTKKSYKKLPSINQTRKKNRDYKKKKKLSPIKEDEDQKEKVCFDCLQSGGKRKTRKNKNNKKSGGGGDWGTFDPPDNWNENQRRQKQLEKANLRKRNKRRDDLWQQREEGIYMPTFRIKMAQLKEDYEKKKMEIMKERGASPTYSPLHSSGGSRRITRKKYIYNKKKITRRKSLKKKRKTKKIKSRGAGGPFSKKTPDTFGREGSAVRDPTEEEEYPFEEGDRYKFKGQKREIVVNMKYYPWEEGFRPQPNDPYGDGPFLEFDGQKNRVVPTKRGSWSTKKNVELADAYEKTANEIKHKKNIEHNKHVVTNPLHQYEK